MIPQIKFNKVYLILAITITAIFISCEEGISKQSATADGFDVIEKEIKSKFGENAFYTDLSITYNNSTGNIVTLTVSEIPESLRMEQWNSTLGNWEKNQDISIEVPYGKEASDFMFQLNNEINLTKLGSLVETSSKELSAKKNIENPILHMAFIKFPKNGDLSKTEYVVILKPETGRTAFTFLYSINTELIKMDY